jgi:hypothetical protein
MLSEIQHFIIDWMGYITIIIFILLFVGIIQKEPTYFVEIIFIFMIFICLYLMYRFNDFRKNIKFTEIDRKVCFVGGTYLFFLSFADLIQVYTVTIKDKIQSILNIK